MKKALIILLTAVLVISAGYLIWSSTNSPTVDFSGVVTDLKNAENKVLITVKSNPDDETSPTYRVEADSRTDCRLYYNNEKVSFESIKTGDTITGDYRLFSESKASHIDITPDN